MKEDEEIVNYKVVQQIDVYKNTNSSLSKSVKKDQFIENEISNELTYRTVLSLLSDSHEYHIIFPKQTTYFEYFNNSKVIVENLRKIIIKLKSIKRILQLADIDESEILTYILFYHTTINLETSTENLVTYCLNYDTLMNIIECFHINYKDKDIKVNKNSLKKIIQMCNLTYDERFRYMNFYEVQEKTIKSYKDTQHSDLPQINENVSISNKEDYSAQNEQNSPGLNNENKNAEINMNQNIIPQINEDKLKKDNKNENENELVKKDAENDKKNENSPVIDENKTPKKNNNSTSNVNKVKNKSFKKVKKHSTHKKTRSSVDSKNVPKINNLELSKNINNIDNENNKNPTVANAQYENMNKINNESIPTENNNLGNNENNINESPQKLKNSSKPNKSPNNSSSNLNSDNNGNNENNKNGDDKNLNKIENSSSNNNNNEDKKEDKDKDKNKEKNEDKDKNKNKKEENDSNINEKSNKEKENENLPSSQNANKDDNKPDIQKNGKKSIKAKSQNKIKLKNKIKNKVLPQTPHKKKNNLLKYNIYNQKHKNYSELESNVIEEPDKLGQSYDIINTPKMKLNNNDNNNYNNNNNNIDNNNNNNDNDIYYYSIDNRLLEENKNDDDSNLNLNKHLNNNKNKNKDKNGANNKKANGAKTNGNDDKNNLNGNENIDPNNNKEEKMNKNNEDLNDDKIEFLLDQDANSDKKKLKNKTSPKKRGSPKKKKKNILLEIIHGSPVIYYGSPSKRKSIGIGTEIGTEPETKAMYPYNGYTKFNTSSFAIETPEKKQLDIINKKKDDYCYYPFILRKTPELQNKSIYLSGSLPKLGNWDPLRAIKLDEESRNGEEFFSKYIEVLRDEIPFEYKFFYYDNGKINWIGIPFENYLTFPQFYESLRALTKSHISIIDLNIRYVNNIDGINVWDNRKNKLIELLLNKKADIFFFQEITRIQSDFIDRYLSSIYEFVGEYRDSTDASEKCSICVNKLKYTIIHHGQFWLSSTPDVPGSNDFGNFFPRICTWATLKQIEGISLLFMNVHLDHVNLEAHLPCVRVLIEEELKIEQRFKDIHFVFIAGCFYCEENAKEIKYIKDQGYTEIMYENTFHGFTGIANNHWDYMFWKEKDGDDIEFKEAHVLKKEGTIDESKNHYISDHFPVYAEFFLNNIK